MKNNMKHNSKKIARYSLLAIAASAILPMGCKKEEEVDDPEIDFLAANFTLSYSGAVGTAIDSTNLMLLGNDFDIYLTSSTDYKYVYVDFDGDAKFQKTNYVSVNGDDWDMVRTLDKGTVIDTSTAKWLDGSSSNDDTYMYVFDKDPLPGAKSGIAGQGDKYVAFRTGTGSSFKYGWIKVNVSADANTFSIKEIAMANVANKVIKVGDK